MFAERLKNDVTFQAANFTNGSFDEERAKESIRLSRLFGSNIQKIPRRRRNSDTDKAISILDDVTAVSDCCSECESVKDATTRTESELRMERLARPRKTETKFCDRPKEAQMLRGIHESRSPWFVGYQNSPTPPNGAPLAIAARYGCIGAMKVAEQTVPWIRMSGLGSARVDRLVSNLAQLDEWAPPKLAAPQGITFGPLGGGGNLESTPRLWTDTSDATKKHFRCAQGAELEVQKKSQTKRNVTTTVRNDLSPHLQRAISKEAAIWNKVAEGGKREMLIRRKKQISRIAYRMPRQPDRKGKIFILS